MMQGATERKTSKVAVPDNLSSLNETLTLLEQERYLKNRIRTANDVARKGASDVSYLKEVSRCRPRELTTEYLRAPTHDC